MPRTSAFHREAKLNNDREHLRRERLRAMRLVGESRLAMEMAMIAIEDRMNSATARTFRSILGRFEILLSSIQSLPDEKETR